MYIIIYIYIFVYMYSFTIQQTNIHGQWPLEGAGRVGAELGAGASGIDPSK